MNTCSRTFSTNAGGFDNVINPQFTITVNIINLLMGSSGFQADGALKRLVCGSIP